QGLKEPNNVRAQPAVINSLRIRLIPLTSLSPKTGIKIELDELVTRQEERANSLLDTNSPRHQRIVNKELILFLNARAPGGSDRRINHVRGHPVEARNFSLSEPARLKELCLLRGDRDRLKHRAARQDADSVTVLDPGVILTEHRLKQLRFIRRRDSRGLDNDGQRCALSDGP